MSTSDFQSSESESESAGLAPSLSLSLPAVLARIEAIKAAFRREAGSNAMDDSRAAWLARRKTMAQLALIGATAIEIEESLQWADLRPELTEEEADAPLRGLLTATLKLFGLLEGSDFFPTAIPGAHTLASGVEGREASDSAHGLRSHGCQSLSAISSRDPRG